ncbi:hypothetical protein FBU30_000146 [Linnemannia zychae]|nr:hypothetical protein FBU30_000146 [Linnemannia zychae]
MGKLTSLLKKKKSKSDDLSAQRSGSAVSGSPVSADVSAITAVISAPPLSLNISTNETSTAECQSSFSLMDDIMDELAGATPDTPQPSKSSDLSGGLVPMSTGLFTVREKRRKVKEWTAELCVANKYVLSGN